MARRKLSREELFALVWEKPTSEVARQFGVSDVAISKLCTRLQVPKPPRGYWARVGSGQTPRRPPLAAFREEVDRRRREAVRVKAAGLLSKLQQQFYQSALSDLKSRGVDVGGAENRGSRLPNLNPDLAAQILLLIQSRGDQWLTEQKVPARWSHSALRSAANLVGKLLPLARPQLLVFESEDKKSPYAESGPVVFVRFTASLQERIATLVRIVRDQKLHHVVMPLMAADFSWVVHHIYVPDSNHSIDSTLCVSATEIWVQCMRKAWREEDPPERISSGRLTLQTIMPIDYMPVQDVPLSPVISRAAVEPYRERLRALLEAEGVHEMMSNAAYNMEREVPDETLAIADRMWFGDERPFRSARDAWRRLEEELHRWELDLETERSALAQSILRIDKGDVVTTQRGARLLRLSVTEVSLYASERHVTFIVNGTRFRKDGTLGKVQDTLTLRFESES